MVNHIDEAETPEEIRRRCKIAEQYLINNLVITDEDFDELMKAVAYLVRESYH